MRLLVVEDNEDVAGLLGQALAMAGFAFDRVGGGEDARVMLAAARYAAVVLDLGLPDGDGLEVLRWMRLRQDATPVLVLTARGGVNDRVAGLQAGTDDYLVKPFAVEELVARLQALLRRPGALLGRRLQVGNLAFDTETREAFVDDQPQRLSARELEVLELLMRRSGRVVPKKHVEDQLFGVAGDIGSNAVEVYVHRLRKRLERKGATADIHTVRGVGYILAVVTP